MESPSNPVCCRQSISIVRPYAYPWPTVDGYSLREIEFQLVKFRCFPASKESLTNHPVALAQIITNRMSQIVDGRNLCEYRGEALGATVDQWSVAGNVIAADAVAHVALFVITTINASIHVIQVQSGDNRFQFVEFFAVLRAERGHQFFEFCEMRPRLLVQ